MFLWKNWGKKLSCKVIVTKYRDGICTGLFRDGKAVELSYSPKESKFLLGNIYIGKVTNVVKNIQAAFVEIEDGVTGYLSLEQNQDPYFTVKTNSSRVVSQDELLVQIEREAVKTKAPSLTSKIRFTGKYLVLTYGKSGIGFSNKLTKEQKAAMLPVIKPYESREYGWIVRTNCRDAAKEEIVADANRLLTRYQELFAQAQHRPCRTCLYRAPDAWLKQITNFYSSDYEEILTDDPVLFDEIHDFLMQYQMEDLHKLSLYKDRLLPLIKLYSVESAFEEALKERIWLKSGGYLVIQPTEALTVIDVNSGKYDGKKQLQDTFLKINLEAARETARQLRLRNLSGIVIVDFINMESKEHQKTVMEELRAALKNDPKKAVLVDMTPLGLVEITRKREDKPLHEKILQNSEKKVDVRKTIC